VGPSGALVSLDDEIAMAVEDDVVVDDDLLLGHDRRRTATAKRVRSTSNGDRVTNPLLGTGKYSDAATLLTGLRVEPACRAVLDKHGVTFSIDAHRGGAGVAIVAILRVLTFGHSTASV